jgi:hypothetical protein
VFFYLHVDFFALFAVVVVFMSGGGHAGAGTLTRPSMAVVAATCVLHPCGPACGDLSETCLRQVVSQSSVVRVVRNQSLTCRASFRSIQADLFGVICFGGC